MKTTKFEVLKIEIPFEEFLAKFELEGKIRHIFSLNENKTIYVELEVEHE